SARAPPRVDRDPSDPLAERAVDGRRGRLLDELLVAALDSAVPLARVHDVTMRAGEPLHVDVLRSLEVPLHVDGGIGEVLLALPGRRLERTLGVARTAEDPPPFPAPPCRGLDDERVPDLVPKRRDLLGRPDRIHGTGDDRHARVAHD